MTPARVPQRVPGVLDAVLDGEAVLYVESTGVPLLLNTSATQVWMLVDGVTDEGGIVRVLATAHACDPVGLAGDVAAALDRLVELGAVTFGP